MSTTRKITAVVKVHFNEHGLDDRMVPGFRWSQMVPISATVMTIELYIPYWSMADLRAGRDTGFEKGVGLSLRPLQRLERRFGGVLISEMVVHRRDGCVRPPIMIANDLMPDAAKYGSPAFKYEKCPMEWATVVETFVHGVVIKIAAGEDDFRTGSSSASTTPSSTNGRHALEDKESGESEAAPPRPAPWNDTPKVPSSAPTANAPSKSRKRARDDEPSTETEAALPHKKARTRIAMVPTSRENRRSERTTSRKSNERTRAGAARIAGRLTTKATEVATTRATATTNVHTMTVPVVPPMPLPFMAPQPIYYGPASAAVTPMPPQFVAPQPVHHRYPITSMSAIGAGPSRWFPNQVAPAQQFRPVRPAASLAGMPSVAVDWEPRRPTTHAHTTWTMPPSPTGFSQLPNIARSLRSRDMRESAAPPPPPTDGVFNSHLIS
ncbi:hypothetical protein BKA93DRAFT_154359 [Sparassis latifolia]